MSDTKPSILSPEIVASKNPGIVTEQGKSVAKQFFIGATVVIVAILGIAFFTKPSRADNY